jgi:hypothetical protein
MTLTVHMGERHAMWGVKFCIVPLLPLVQKDGAQRGLDQQHGHPYLSQRPGSRKRISLPVGRLDSLISAIVRVSLEGKTARQQVLPPVVANRSA